MSRSLNSHQIIGHLTKDPDVRQTQNGTSVANFDVATGSSYKDSDGNWQETTTYHKVVVWAKQAEACGEYLKKGSQVYVRGEVQERSWEDKDGNKKYMREIKADTVLFLSKPTQNNNDTASSGSSAPKFGATKEPSPSDPAFFSGGDGDSDDLPF